MMRPLLARAVSLLVLGWAVPLVVFGAGLININTASEATLETLPGIGPTYAARIVAYRTAHGPFVTTEAIEAVKGIGPSTYAKLAPRITVGSSAGAEEHTNIATSSLGTTASAAGSAEETTAAPMTLQVHATIPDTFYVHEPTSLSAVVTDASGGFDTHARVYWNFGNGATTEGMQVTHTYQHTGTYAVVAMATDGATTVRTEHTVVVAVAPVAIVSIRGEGITLENNATTTLNLSQWRITSSKGVFRMPAGTVLVPHVPTLFPFALLHLAIAYNAVLTYPDGIVAARYPHPETASSSVPVSASVQPFRNKVGLSNVVRVVGITSNSALAHLHENKPTVAPAAATNSGAAAGAPVDTHGTSAAPNTLLSHFSFITPWTLGLAGVMTLAGAAFIFL